MNTITTNTPSMAAEKKAPFTGGKSAPSAKKKCKKCGKMTAGKMCPDCGAKM